MVASPMNEIHKFMKCKHEAFHKCPEPDYSVEDRSLESWIAEGKGSQIQDRKTSVCQLLLSTGHVVTCIVYMIDGKSEAPEDAFGSVEVMPYIGYRMHINISQVVAAWDYVQDQVQAFTTDILAIKKIGR